MKDNGKITIENRNADKKVKKNEQKIYWLSH